jgi:hypothetical protein
MNNNNTQVWTGLDPQGTPTNQDCGNWSLPFGQGDSGQTTAAPGQWLFSFTAQCSNPQPIYCFGTMQTQPLVLLP